MRSSTATARLVAASLGVLLTACSAVRGTTPASAAELADVVLIISEQPGGHVSAGAGLVVLAPIALVASPAILSEPYIAEVSQ